MSVSIMTSIFAGCGTQNEQTKDSSASKDSNTTVKVEEKNPVTITMFTQQGTIDQSLGKVKEAFETENPNIKIEFNVLPGDNIGAYAKQDLALLSGDNTDIVWMPNANIQTKYNNSKVIMPLNDVAKKANFDMEKVFGKYLKKDNSGAVTMLPYELSLNVVFFNKKIFDDAKVPYPTGDWTWDQYVEIGKKLTDNSKGIYGSIMQCDWEYFSYIQAMQKKVPPYKEDGTSNLDDPAFMDSLKFFKDLSDVYKIQPGYTEFKAKKLQYDSFMSGKFGMQMIGTWFLGVVQDYTKYPRDWKVGVCAPPAQADGKNILANLSTYGINDNSKNVDVAFKALTYITSDSYKVSGSMPARVDLTKDEITNLFKTTSEKLKSEVSPEDLNSACYSSNLGITDEKIAGFGSAQINEAYVKEGTKYLLNSQSLEETMKNLKKQADDFIAKDKASQK